MKSFGIILVWLVGFLPLSAYDFITAAGLRWPDGEIPMKLQLDSTMTPIVLLDGKTSWDAVAQEALGLWNAQLSRVQFVPFTDLGRGDGNDQNEVFFSSQVYGHRFGSFVLAVTTTWRIGSRRVEGDTIFNTAIEWDSYRGDLASPVYDLRRVALHEFGHTLGLDHPDQAGQIEVAAMNSRITDLDSLAEDDIRGARALYPPDRSFKLNLHVTPVGSGEVTAFPPPDSEGKYPAGTLVTLRSTPYRKNRFAVWSGDENRNGRALKLRVVDDETVVANFSTNGAPAIRTQPRSRFATFGDSVTFRVAAVSGTAAQYQWQLDGSDIPEATSTTLFLNFVTHASSGLYSCRVTNARGSTTSLAARLVVDGY
jgi:hypothetical protein